MRRSLRRIFWLNPISVALIKRFAQRQYYNALHEFTVPRWDIERPQSEMVRLAEHGAIKGAVLDVGCGKGELALHLASLGFHVLGIDSSEAAVKNAMQKARHTNLTVDFLVANALTLDVDKRFDTAVDSGFFQILTPTKRKEFAASLWKVLKPYGRYYSLGLSDRPNCRGPCVSIQSIEDTFSHGWRIEYIHDALMEHLTEKVPARLFVVTKVDPPRRHGNERCPKSSYFIFCSA